MSSSFGRPSGARPATTTTKGKDETCAHHCHRFLPGALPRIAYFFPGQQQRRTLLITADRITTAKAGINAREFGQKTLKLLRVMRNPRYDPRPLANEMYDALFKPIESEVNEAGATLLMWSLDGSLRYLPMGALWDGQRYLAERYQHAVFTRASSERLLAEVSRDWTGLGFGSAKARTVKQGERQITFGALCGVPRELGLIFGNRATNFRATNDWKTEGGCIEPPGKFSCNRTARTRCHARAFPEQRNSCLCCRGFP